jgi:hypothetical protein
MNNGKILLASVLISGTVLVTSLVLKNNFSTQYKPLTDEIAQPNKAADFNGASAWWFNLLKDENGQINPERMQKIAAEVAAMQRSGARSSSAWNLNFSEIGPDNVGGRTRAICFDKKDYYHMFPADCGRHTMVAATGHR